VRRALALGLVLALALLAACGEEARQAGRERLVVSAAASLREALTACSRGFPAQVALSFAGSDELAAQIRQGVRPDVYAAANTRLPDALAAEGLLRAPVAFATNELVLAVPAGEEGAPRGLDDLAREGVDLAVGSASVPVGAYTHEVLGRLPAHDHRSILANVRSNEPDAKGVIGKLTQRAVDAGFVYRSDVAATDGRLAAIALPARLRPTVTYGAGVLARAPRPALAQRYLQGMRSGACARALRQAGFGAPGR